jgi:hypothetical protein
MEAQEEVVSMAALHQVLDLQAQQVFKVMLVDPMVLTVDLVLEHLLAQVVEVLEEWVSQEHHLEVVLEALVHSALLLETFLAEEEVERHRVSGAKHFLLVLVEEVVAEEVIQIQLLLEERQHLEHPTQVRIETCIDKTSFDKTCTS